MSELSSQSTPRGLTRVSSGNVTRRPSSRWDSNAAQIISTAVKNESLGLLYETTRMLAEKPVDSESLTRVLSMVRQALGVESGALCSIHGDSKRGMPLARDETTVKACRGVECHNCADGGRVTWRTEPGETGERRILGIPLVEGGVSYGVMPLVLPPGKGLEVWQLELAETMGRHIGGALASAERRDEHRFVDEGTIETLTTWRVDGGVLRTVARTTRTYAGWKVEHPVKDLERDLPLWERCFFADPADLAHWLRGWHDREGAWTNLRNVEHWMERAGA